MRDIILSIIGKYGYIGVLLLIAAENLFPPIPSEVILTFAGFVTGETELTFVGMVVASTLGSLVGAVILYAIGRFVSADKLGDLLNGKCGKILHLEREDINKASVWFISKGSKSVFFCRMIPILRSLISIPAGMAKMKFVKFICLTAVGSTLWNILLIGFGAIAGENWEKVNAIFQKASINIKVIVIIVLILLGLYLYTHNKSRYKNKS
ncbi:MAG: DedA family protein [Oscillospiraceae bacterium]